MYEEALNVKKIENGKKLLNNFSKVAFKLLLLCSMTLLVFTVGCKSNKNAPNGKLKADYYVYKTETEIRRSQTNLSNTYYSDIASVLIFFKYKEDNIVELFSFKRMNSSSGTNSYSSLLGWGLNDYLPIKYIIKNKNEIYLLNDDGSYDENSYWTIQGNSIITPDGKELVGMSETEFRRTTEIGIDCLKQNYSSKVKSGEIQSVYEVYLKEKEKTESNNN